MDEIFILTNGKPMLSTCVSNSSSRTPCMEIRRYFSLMFVSKHMTSYSCARKILYNDKAESLPPLQFKIIFSFIVDFPFCIHLCASPPIKNHGKARGFLSSFALLLPFYLFFCPSIFERYGSIKHHFFVTRVLFVQNKIPFAEKLVMLVGICFGQGGFCIGIVNHFQ